jgi:hypothetical protein
MTSKLFCHFFYFICFMTILKFHLYFGPQYNFYNFLKKPSYMMGYRLFGTNATFETR